MELRRGQVSQAVEYTERVECRVVRMVTPTGWLVELPNGELRIAQVLPTFTLTGHYAGQELQPALKGSQVDKEA